MSNSGRISRACLNCKESRVKCDRTIPQCLRCTKADKTCPGYPDESALVFRDMNQISERKVKSRIARKDHHVNYSRYGDIRLSPHDGSTTFLYTTQAGFPPSSDIYWSSDIPAPLNTNWHETAAPRFLADYVFQSDVVQWGNLRFLPDIFSKNSSCPHLEESFQAVALVSLANQTGLSYLAIEARKLYGSAIKRVAKILGNVEESRKDSMLASVYMFSMYEILSSKPLPTSFWNASHGGGRASLLRIRGEDPLRTPVAKNLFYGIYGHHILKCVASHINPPEESLIWIEQSGIVSPYSQLQPCLYATAQFCASAQILFDSSSRDEQWVLSLLQLVKKAISIEKSYEAWTGSTCGVWSYKICRLPSMVAQKYPLHFYHDICVAFDWNTFRTARLRHHEVLLHCITLIRAHPSNQSLCLDPEITRKESMSVIADMVVDVCSSISFCLGEIDSNGEPNTKIATPIHGYLAMWPLYIALVSAEDGSETKAWLRAKLEYISDSMGIQLARRLARRERVDPWDIR